MSAIWGVFIWREFKGASKGVKNILAAMFLFFVVGLALIIWTKLGADEPAPEQEAQAIETVVEEAVSEDALPEFDALMESETEIDVEEAPAL